MASGYRRDRQKLVNMLQCLTLPAAPATPANMNEALFARPCFAQDMEQVTLIYGHHVLTGFGTFELAPPSLEDMTARWTRIAGQAWPWIVVSPRSDPSRVLGFAYAAPFRDRPAYARTFEDSIYVSPSSQRMGVGRLLLGELLATLKADGVREVIAVIGDSQNHSSIGLHRAAHFRLVGTMTGLGFKFGRWVDVVIMQRSLRA
jgi:phosphinothricin acetyltransferase